MPIHIIDTGTQSITGDIIVQGLSSTQNLQQWRNTSGSTLATVTSAGNMVLNTTNTADKINAGGNITTYGGDNGFLMYNLGANYTGNFEVARFMPVGNVYTFQVLRGGTGVGRDLNFNVGQATIFLKNSTGNVGINTTTPNAPLTVVGNISGTGTNNLLSNQQELSSTSILTRSSLDRRDQFTQSSFARITGNDVYQLGVMEHFNDFLEIYQNNITSPNTFTTTVTGTAGSLGQSFTDGWSIDILIQLPVNNDKFTSRGVLQIQTSGNFNSVTFTCANLSMHQNLGAYYGSSVGWRVWLAQTDSTTFYRFGGQMPLGGQFGSNILYTQRSLCFDGGVSPNFFFGDPNTLGTVTTRGYTVSADTGIPVLSCVWANIYMDYIPSPTAYNTLSVIDLTVVYPLSGLRYTYRFTPPDGSTNSTHNGWWKQNPTGLLIGQADIRGAPISRKAVLLDWWYLKTQPLSANITYPSNWNSIRFTK